MNKLSKIILTVSNAGLSTFAVLNLQNNSVLPVNGDNTCHHEDNHYLATSATETTHGCDEYWICCK